MHSNISTFLHWLKFINSQKGNGSFLPRTGRIPEVFNVTENILQNARQEKQRHTIDTDD